jgi:GT2 family glycosyltransferase
MVSVVIPNWNGKRYLKTCLESLRNQSYRDFETIIVDNGSTDGSVEFVRQSFPEVRLLEFKGNEGFSVAVNEGIRLSAGKYVALLNNDTEVHPDWLKELVAGVEGEEDVGFCASKILYSDRRNIINSAGDAVSVAGYAWNVGKGSEDDGRFDTRRDVFGASAAASLYRRDMLEKIGLFDEDYFAYFEDVDLSFRAQLSGYRCLYLPQAVVYHKEGGASRHHGDLAVFYIERNAILNLVKNVPLPVMILYFHTIFLCHAQRFAACLLKGRLPVWISAKLSALPYILRAGKKRQVIQRERRVSISNLGQMLEKRRVLWK